MSTITILVDGLEAITFSAPVGQQPVDMPAPTNVVRRTRKRSGTRMDRRRWTIADEAALLRMHDTGATTRQMAHALGRSVSAIGERRARLGIPGPSGRQKTR